MKQRILNDSLGRALHGPLYQRMHHFCQQYTPEFPADAIVTAWLNRLYGNDPDLHILVQLTEQYQIVSHGVVDVQNAFGQRVVFVHQAFADKGKQSYLDEGIEYVEKLAQHVGAYCIMFMASTHTKALDKKFGYKVSRTVMVKVIGEGSPDDDSGSELDT